MNVKTYQAEEVIRDSDGNIIRRSRNLRGIRRHAGIYAIKLVGISPIGESLHEGKLMILFHNGDSYETNFASYQVLKNTVRNWRNLYGAKLVIHGENCGTVSYSNPALNC